MKVINYCLGFERKKSRIAFVLLRPNHSRHLRQKVSINRIATGVLESLIGFRWGIWSDRGFCASPLSQKVKFKRRTEVARRTGKAKPSIQESFPASGIYNIEGESQAANWKSPDQTHSRRFAWDDFLRIESKKVCAKPKVRVLEKFVR